MKPKIIKSQNLKPKFEDASKLKFGRTFTDHMLTMKYNPEKGWHDMQVEPHGSLDLDPACTVLHYGQAIFEGMKAYVSPEGELLLFRPDQNFARMNSSARRLSIPEFDADEVMEGLFELIKLDHEWIPKQRGTALYIRPTIIATDAFLGLKVSDTYLFFIILSPVGPYFANGMSPISIYVEDEYVRAVKGGTGDAKVAGNYAASLLATQRAKKKGYDQVLWLDGIEHKYCEEVGAMNMFFVIDNTVVTPALSGSILPGITRKSIIQVAKDMGYKVEERAVSIDEVYEAHEKGILNEAFGAGTAAVITPVGKLCYKGKNIVINNNETGEIAQKFYDRLTGIQMGLCDDPYGWSVVVK